MWSIGIAVPHPVVFTRMEMLPFEQRKGGKRAVPRIAAGVIIPCCFQANGGFVTAAIVGGSACITPGTAVTQKALYAPKALYGHRVPRSKKQREAFLQRHFLAPREGEAQMPFAPAAGQTQEAARTVAC